MNEDALSRQLSRDPSQAVGTLEKDGSQAPRMPGPMDKVSRGGMMSFCYVVLSFLLALLRSLDEKFFSLPTGRVLFRLFTFAQN